MCLKAIMRFRIDHMEIVYHVSAGIFFPLFFFWKYDESKEKGIACVALKLGGKRKLKITTTTTIINRSSATTSSNSLYDADTSDDD